QSSVFEGADEFGADLVKAAAVGFALFVQNFGHFGAYLHGGFGVMLDFQVHHFLDEMYPCLRSHKGFIRTAGVLCAACGPMSCAGIWLTGEANLRPSSYFLTFQRLSYVMSYLLR